jgi:hypothetical protein
MPNKLLGGSELFRQRQQKEKDTATRRSRTVKMMLAMLSKKEPSCFSALYLRIRDGTNDFETTENFGHILHHLWQFAGFKKELFHKGEAIWWVRTGHEKTCELFSHSTRERLDQWGSSLKIKDEMDKIHDLEAVPGVVPSLLSASFSAGNF